uniref:Protein arginine N-methyltransferase n=1 Tax=Ditylenchus dipsaci TaxID=166011 RepID=A0A915E3G7_9BILA
MAYFDVLDDDDMQQDLARSAFGDMLLDEDRNLRYKQALISVIRQQHAISQPANVVDIGTGSGLLSLLAAQAGADTITAVEMFTPMADIAERIFKSSQYEDKIMLIKGKSTDFTNAADKGSIIVAEKAYTCYLKNTIFSELIGEGALRTFKEAHGTLVKKCSKVIPASARVWLLPVQSPELQKFNKAPSKLLKTPFDGCAGSAAVFDIQVSEFTDFERICEPFVAFSFNFEDPDTIKYDECVVHELISKHNAIFDAVIMWWDLDMDGLGNNYICMAPTWIDAHSPWRDHWMQCVYYPPKPLNLYKDQKFKLFCAHDEFSFWFCNGEDLECNQKPICTCQMHVICPRSAFYRLNDLEDENQKFVDHVIQYSQNKSVVCLSEGSLLGLNAAKSAEHVVIVEPSPYFQNVLLEYQRANNLNNVTIRQSINQLDDKLQIDSVISEPFFLSSILPSDNFKFFSEFKTLTQKYYSQEVDCFLKAITLFAMPVEFEHLWKTVAPFQEVQGFDLSPYSKVNQKAIQESDEAMDAQPLGNIPQYRLAPYRTGTNAVVFWIEAEFENNLKLSSGLLQECRIGEKPQWHRGHRQGVHFIQSTNSNSQLISVNVSIKIGKDFVPELRF